MKAVEVHCGVALALQRETFPVHQSCRDWLNEQGDESNRRIKASKISQTSAATNRANLSILFCPCIQTLPLHREDAADPFASSGRSTPGSTGLMNNVLL